jgi:uncharacterized membrane protein
MENLVADEIGLVHLISSCLALLFGTYILIAKKGTKTHVKIGYLYVASMGILILTAFMIYRLFNGWGIFHYSTLLSLITLLMGMLPIWRKRPKDAWKFYHFTFMYWSVMGLYAAFAAEVLTRIPKAPFFGMVGIATAAIMLVGGVVFGMNKSKWKNSFS